MLVELEWIFNTIDLCRNQAIDTEQSTHIKVESCQQRIVNYKHKEMCDVEFTHSSTCRFEIIELFIANVT